MGDATVHCGLDDADAVPLSDVELEGVRRALAHYRSDELIPRILARLDVVEERGARQPMRWLPAGTLRDIADEMVGDRRIRGGERLRAVHAVMDAAVRIGVAFVFVVPEEES